MTSLADSPEARRQEAVRVASEMYKTQPPWVDFFREILGVGGVLAQLFPKVGDMKAFQQTAEYREIQDMLKQLREQRPPEAEEDQTRVITIRLPAALHESLRGEAKVLETSMNRLCIAKLIQQVDEDALQRERKAPRRQK